MALARVDSGGALFSGPVVVLADKDKEEMDELVRGMWCDSSCLSCPGLLLECVAMCLGAAGRRGMRNPLLRYLKNMLGLVSGMSAVFSGSVEVWHHPFLDRNLAAVGVCVDACKAYTCL